MSLTAVVDACPNSAAFFGFMGVTAAVVFCSENSRLSSMLFQCCHAPPLSADLGSAYGTAKSGVGLASMGVIHADRVMRNIIPVIMAGILGIYGLIVGAILVGRSEFCRSVSEILPQGSPSFSLILYLLRGFMSTIHLQSPPLMHRVTSTVPSTATHTWLLVSPVALHRLLPGWRSACLGTQVCVLLASSPSFLLR